MKSIAKQIKLYPIIFLLLMLCLNILGYSQGKKEYTGTVMPMVTNDFSWGWNDFYRGKVLYTPMPGDILAGPVKNIDGKVVQKGDLLIRVNQKYRKAVYIAAKAKVIGDKAEYMRATKQLDRDEELLKTHAVSEMEFDTNWNIHQTDQQNIIADESDALAAKRMLGYILFRAQFDCIIDKVYTPFGLLAGESNVLRLSQISPIGVRINLDIDKTTDITDQTPVTVYPLRSDKPVGIFHGYYTNTDKGLTLTVDNYVLLPETDENTVPVYDFNYVLNFYPDKTLYKQLSVPVDCLNKDSKGFFVLRAKGAQDGQPGKALPAKTSLEKIYVKPGNLIRKLTPQYYYRILEDPAGLKICDIIISNEEAKKVNGKNIALYNRELLFMPGDKVKVVIGK